jgi:leader peptidase (prepilin peptidase)/N-methyltransferase
MALQGRDRAAPLPFGPWLAGAGAVALFFGQQINALYLR